MCRRVSTPYLQGTKVPGLHSPGPHFHPQILEAEHFRHAAHRDQTFHSLTESAEKVLTSGSEICVVSPCPRGVTLVDVFEMLEIDVDVVERSRT